MNYEKFNGILPAFYACYDDNGNVSVERTVAFADYLYKKGVKGLYIAGSSGECIYQNVEERKLILETVVQHFKGKMTLICHVAANSTRESMMLAEHAEKMGVDAIAAIPPIYFKLPDYAIEKYWNDISSAAPNTPFIIYNIPQLAGTALSSSLLQNMLKNKNVIGVKNSSMPTQDILTFKAIGGENFVVLNGPDEQFVSGRMMGACGGIGGTYAVMPEMYLKMDALIREGKAQACFDIQKKCNQIISKLCSGKGNMYAVIKGVLKLQGMDIGSVRPPFFPLQKEDDTLVQACYQLIKESIQNL